MATYRPSFVDVSGLTQGISKGLFIAAEKKRQDEIKAEANVDNFLKNYKPDKLRQDDIGKFISAYDNYRQNAIKYSRLNRGGAKSNELSKSKMELDNSLNNLNLIYSNSIKAANKSAEYAEYIKRARLNNLSLPQEVLDNYNILTSSDIDTIDLDKIQSAYSYELIKKEPDYKRLENILNSFGASPVSSETVNKVEIGKISGKSIFGDLIETVQSRPVDKTIQAVKIAMSNDNAMKKDADILYKNFKENPSIYLTELNKLIPELNEQNVTPEILYAYQYFSPKVISRKRDNSTASLQVQSIKFQSDESYRNAVLQLRKQDKKEKEKEKRPQIDPVKEITNFENTIKNTPKYQKAIEQNSYIEVPDVKGFSGVSKFKFANAMVDYIRYYPKLNNQDSYYIIKTNAPGDKEQKLSPKELRNILVQGTKGAANKPYESDDTLITLDELNSVGYKPDDELLNILKTIEF